MSDLTRRLLQAVAKERVRVSKHESTDANADTSEYILNKITSITKSNNTGCINCIRSFCGAGDDVSEDDLFQKDGPYTIAARFAQAGPCKPLCNIEISDVTQSGIILLNLYTEVDVGVVATSVQEALRDTEVLKDIPASTIVKILGTVDMKSVIQTGASALIVNDIVIEGPGARAVGITQDAAVDATFVQLFNSSASLAQSAISSLLEQECQRIVASINATFQEKFRAALESNWAEIIGAGSFFLIILVYSIIILILRRRSGSGSA